MNLVQPLTVRQAVMADLPALATLFGQYREFQGQVSDPAAELQFLRDRLDHGESVLFIATLGSTAVGLAQLYPLFSSVSMTRVLILNDLYVLPSGRRQGVAGGLLAALEAYARTVALRGSRCPWPAPTGWRRPCTKRGAGSWTKHSSCTTAIRGRPPHRLRPTFCAGTRHDPALAQHSQAAASRLTTRFASK